MKLTSAQADPDALFSPVKTVTIRATRWGVVAQRRPRKGAIKQTALQKAYVKRWSIAARMAANPTGLDLAAAIEASRGTQQVPRDILTMAALGRYYLLEMEDGTPWGHVPGPTFDPDLVSEPRPTPEPPKDKWSDMNWSCWDGAWSAPDNVNAYAFHGSLFTPMAPHAVKAGAAILNAVNTGTYQLALGTMDANNKIASVTLSAPHTPSQSGHQALPFEITATLDPTMTNFAMIGRTDQGPTHTLPIAGAVRGAWLFPCRRGMRVRLASIAPAIGDPLNIVASFTTVPIGLSF